MRVGLAILDIDEGLEHPGSSVKPQTPRPAPDQPPKVAPPPPPGSVVWQDTPSKPRQIDDPSLCRQVATEVHQLHLDQEEDRLKYGKLLHAAVVPDAKILFLGHVQQYNDQRGSWDVLLTVGHFQFRKLI